MNHKLRGVIIAFIAMVFLCSNLYAQESRLETGTVESLPDVKTSNRGPVISKDYKPETPGVLRSSLLSEGFEGVTFPPTGWVRTIHAGTATDRWTRITTITGYGMSNGAAKFDYFNGAVGDKQSLTSPTFAPTTAGEVLQFDMAWTSFTDPSRDTLQIQASIDGINYTDLAFYISDSGSAAISPVLLSQTGPKSGAQANILDSYWMTRKFALPEGTISIRFLSSCGPGNNLYIDNVSTYVPAGLGAMSGVYTVNGALPASSTNYQTLQAAATDLFDRGVSGAVTVLVSPGTYTERIYIRPIAGTSASNTVSFIGAGLVTMNVSNATGTASTSDYGIGMIGCDWVTISGINIVDVGTTAATRITRGIVINSFGSDGPRHNTISGCNITLGGNVGGGATIDAASIGVVIAGYINGITTSTPDTNTVTGCKVDNADRGLGTFAFLGGNNVPYPGMSSNAFTNNTLGSTLALGNNIATGAPIGIIMQGVYNATCSGNTLDSLRCLTASTTVAMTGMTAQVASGNFFNNRIKYMSHPNLTSTTPIVIGFQAGTYPGYNLYVYNNTITGINRPFTGTATGLNLVMGIQVTNFITGGTPGFTANIFNNSVYLSNATTVNYSSACLRVSVSGVPANVYNNLLYNASSTSNAAVSHYAITDTNSSRLNLVSNYNNLVSTGTNGYVGRSSGTRMLSLANWRNVTGPDTNSVSGTPVFSDSKLLSIDVTNAANWVLNGNAKPNSIVATDIAGNTRSTTVAGGMTDIGAYEFTPVSAPPAATMSGTIGTGNTTTWTAFGKTIASITWGAGTLPSSVTAQYYSGTNPPNSSGFNVGNGYWDISATGGSGYSYDITLNYDQSQLGTIPADTNIVLAKSENLGLTYTPYLVYGTGAGEYERNSATNILVVHGLTNFSLFALTDNDAPLPVELASFTSNVNRNSVELSWATSTETNNSGFEIERKQAGSTQWNKAGFVAGKGNSSAAASYSFSDRNLPTAHYNYRLKQIDFNGNYKYYDLSNEVVVGVPVKFELSQNYPNPFNPSTSINFEMPSANYVSMKIFDMAGKEVAQLVNEVKEAGYYTVKFDASKLSSGMYFYKIQAGEFVSVKKMVLVK